MSLFLCQYLDPQGPHGAQKPEMFNVGSTKCYQKFNGPIPIPRGVKIGFVQSENWICAESFSDLFFKKCVSAGGLKGLLQGAQWAPSPLQVL